MKDSTLTTNSIHESSGVHLKATTFSLESAYGSVKPSQSPEDFKEISRVAKEDKAEKTARELRDT